MGAPEDGAFELTWEVFGELCRGLAMKVANDGYRPDIIVGIAKAGVIPGAVMASILRCDFFSLKISRRSGTDRVRETPKILSSVPRQAAGKRVLIVDEICTTGATLRIALNAVRNIKPEEVLTATSFVKAGGFRPDYYALETAGTVIFPWDRQVLSEQGEIIENPQYQGLV